MLNFKEFEDTLTYEAYIPGTQESLLAWHNSDGFVCIESALSGDKILRKVFPIRGRAETEKAAQKFVKEFFENIVKNL